jgi:hypothetical protein
MCYPPLDNNSNSPNTSHKPPKTNIANILPTDTINTIVKIN